MAIKSAEQVAEKWARNMSTAGETMREGVMAVTEAPSAKAVTQQNVMLTNFTEAITSGRWRARMQAVSLEDWRKAFIDKGISRATANAGAAKPKVAAFLQDFLPFVAQGVASLPARGNFDQNITRMVAMAKHNREFRRRA